MENPSTATFRASARESWGKTQPSARPRARPLLRNTRRYAREVEELIIEPDYSDTPGCAAGQLRLTDRNRLLAYLDCLGDADSSMRAKAAAEAAKLLQRKGLTWRALLPGPPAAKPHAAGTWRDIALGLVKHPEVTPTERAFVTKLLGWRAPGSMGLAQLRAIAERVGESR